MGRNGSASRHWLMFWQASPLTLVHIRVYFFSTGRVCGAQPNGACPEGLFLRSNIRSRFPASRPCFSQAALNPKAATLESYLTTPDFMSPRARGAQELKFIRNAAAPLNVGFRGAEEEVRVLQMGAADRRGVIVLDNRVGLDIDAF